MARRVSGLAERQLSGKPGHVQLGLRCVAAHHMRLRHIAETDRAHDLHTQEGVDHFTDRLDDFGIGGIGLFD